MCRCGVGLNPLKDVQGQESPSLCHGQINLQRAPETCRVISQGIINTTS